MNSDKESYMALIAVAVIILCAVNLYILIRLNLLEDEVDEALNIKKQ